MRQRCPQGAPHRLVIQELVLPQRLAHLQSALYQFTIVNTAASAFVQSSFAPLLSARATQKAALRDCLRLHASMWGAATLSTGTQYLYVANNPSRLTPPPPPPPPRRSVMPPLLSVTACVACTKRSCVLKPVGRKHD